MVIKEDQLQWFTSFLKNSTGSGIINEPNYQLARELHKPMINEMTSHFEKKNGNKYLVLNDVSENKEVFKKY